MRILMASVGAVIAVRYISYLRWSLGHEKKTAFFGSFLLFVISAAAVAFTGARL